MGRATDRWLFHSCLVTAEKKQWIRRQRNQSTCPSLFPSKHKTERQQVNNGCSSIKASNFTMTAATTTTTAAAPCHRVTIAGFNKQIQSFHGCFFQSEFPLVNAFCFCRFEYQLLTLFCHRRQVFRFVLNSTDLVTSRIGDQ